MNKNPGEVMQRLREQMKREVAAGEAAYIRTYAFHNNTTYSCCSKCDIGLDAPLKQHHELIVAALKRGLENSLKEYQQVPDMACPSCKIPLIYGSIQYV